MALKKHALDLVKEYGLEDQVCAITFNAKSVPIALEELPTLSLGYLSGVGSVNARQPHGDRKQSTQPGPADEYDFQPLLRERSTTRCLWSRCRAAA